MRKLFTDTTFLAVAELLNRAKFLLFMPLLVRLKGMEGYGAFTQLFVTSRLCGSLAGLELGMGLERFASHFGDEERKPLGRHFFSVLLPATVLGALGSGLLYVCSPFLSRFFFDGQHEASLQASAIVVLSNAYFSAARNYLLARRAFKLQSTLTLAYSLLPYAAFVLGTIASNELHIGAVAYACVDVIVALCGVFLVITRVVWTRPSLSLSLKYVRYTLPLALSTIQGGLLDKVDRYFLSFFHGLDAVGLYNIVLRFTEIASFISQPVKMQMLAYLSPVWDRGGVTETTHLIRQTLLVYLILATGVVVGFVLYFEPLLAILTDEETYVPHLASIVLLIGLAMIAKATRRFLFVLVRLQNATRDEFFSQLLALLLNIVGNCLLVPTYGLLGAAGATLLSYIIVLPVLSRRNPLGITGSFVGHCVSAAFLSLVIVPLRYLIPPNNVPLFVLSATTSYGAYLLAIVLFKQKFLLSLRRSLLEWKEPPK